VAVAEVSRSETGNSEGLATVNLGLEYRTGETDLVSEFYIPCLSQSSKYDRAVGFFRSTVFLVIGQALIEFARRGGSMRLVCSPALTEEDIEALERGHKDREKIVVDRLEQEIEELIDDVNLHDRAEALATLVAVGALDIRIAVRPPDHRADLLSLAQAVWRHGNRPAQRT